MARRTIDPGSVSYCDRRRVRPGRCASLGIAIVVGLACLWPDPGSATTKEFLEASQRDGEILLPRYPSPSPDGTQLAFCYQGDLWTVASAGGTARRLTASPAYDRYPVWSPDGTRLAFASDRDGNEDVFVIPVDGGPVERLTWDSTSDIPTSWVDDGGAVVFQSRRHLRDGWNSGAFLVPASGGLAAPIFPIGSRQAVVSPDGSRVAFVRGSVSWWQTGYEGPGKLRLWLATVPMPLTSEAISVQATAARAALRANGFAWGDAESASSVGYLAEAAIWPSADFQNLTARGSEEGQRRSRPLARGTTPDWAQPELEPGVNSDPQWLPDGEHLLYLSQIHGIANLKLLSIADGKRSFLTRLSGGRLRTPALARDGSLVAYEDGDGIYTVGLTRTGSGWTASEPRRVRITIPLDEMRSTVERVRITSGASEMAVSPDGKQIAFVYEGDVYAMKASEEEPSAYALTATSARERDLAWDPDSESLVYVSDRSGSQDLFRVRSADADEPRLCRSLHLETTQLTSSKASDRRPTFSPDGERVAFLRGLGDLLVVDADGSNERTLVEGWADIDYAWSPDSKWFAFARDDNDFNADVYLLRADGTGEPFNVSRHPDNDYRPTWSANGKVLAFVSDRRFPAQTDIWYAYLTKADDQLSREKRLDLLDEGGKKSGKKGNKGKNGKNDKGKDGDKDKKDSEDGDEDEDEAVEVSIDFEGLFDRLHRVTSFAGRESGVLVSKDASEFFFIGSEENETDLWKVKWDGSDPERLTEGDTSPRFVQWVKDESQIFYLRANGAISSMSAGGGDKKSYSYEAETSIDRFGQRQAVFAEACRELQQKYYDPDMHGAAWAEVQETYGSWAASASTYQDFHDVLKMTLGELQGSHLNVSGGPGDHATSMLEGPEAWTSERAICERIGFHDAPVPPTGDAGSWENREVAGGGLSSDSGHLGTIFDPTFPGPGWRILHVIPNSPADHVASGLVAGEVVLSIDGQDGGPDVDPAALLDRTAGAPVLLSVRGSTGLREVAIRPIRENEARGLLYDDEIEHRRRYVAQASQGRVAYIHIASMNASSVEAFERDLYAQAHGKDALVVDVRDNGGGWTTDILLASLTAPSHATTVPRDGGRGYPQDRRLIYAWTKPIAVLCNEYSYSNAEIFSWSIRATERGPVVGEQTYGAVISTGGTTLGDGTWLRLPFRAWYSNLDGTLMEEEGCLPDLRVENNPVALVAGEDPQLAAAVAEALQQIR